MNALLCSTALAFATTLEGAYVVEERELAWSSLGEETFDPSWFLPEKPSGDDRHLLAELGELTSLEFQLEAADGSPIRTLGDFLTASRGKDYAARNAWWGTMVAQDPALFETWGERLFWLCFDDALYADDWDPEREHPRDGIFEGPTWTLRDADGAPWSSGSDKVLHQAAIWIDADLHAIKEVETDFQRYPDHRGADYEAIYPLENGAWRGTREELGEFSGVTLYFRCDLPFPFGNYECDLRMLHRRDELGRLVTDIYSTSRDFNWLAGRDVFLPLTKHDGSPAGYLLVRIYGFDLAGVPDGAKHRVRALRSSLGNLRLQAEAYEERRATEAGEIPDYTIRGVK